MRAAGLALVALMAFAAVAHAGVPADFIKDKEKMPKKIIIVPDAKLYAEKPKGKPQPFLKQVFVKNNTIIKKEKVKDNFPKMKEAPIKVKQQKPEVQKVKLEVEFIKNNTIIKKQKVKDNFPKFKEEPIKDITKKPPVMKEKVEVEFIKNNTIINKEKVKDLMPKIKELPIKDITKPFKELYDGLKKEAKELYKDEKQKAEYEYHMGGYSDGGYKNRKAL